MFLLNYLFLFYFVVTENNNNKIIIITIIIILIDAYRKNPSASTIDLSVLNSTDDSCWLMLLMIEDEIERARATFFSCLHPIAQHASYYTTLYRSCRFSDHLLAKWFCF